MKKLLAVIAVTLMGHFVFAQEQKQTDVNKDKSAKEFKRHDRANRHAKMEMMKALNLNETQKTQLKEMRKAQKEKRNAIMNDSKLTEDQKREQIKELQKTNAAGMQSVLTDEQKATMKAHREKMKAEKKEHHHEQHMKGMKADKSKEVSPAQ